MPISYLIIALILLCILFAISLKSDKLFIFLATTFFMFCGIMIILFLYFLEKDHYFTFNLNDPKGRYIINYDGDYWLTY